MARAVTGPGVLTLPAETQRHRISAGPDGSIEITRLADEERVGTAYASVEEDVLALQCICIDAESRGYGAGTDAVRLLLSAATLGCRLATAYAPPDNGLAVYFWTRMGFRPRFGHDARGLRFERALR
jgi:ribosomal protein S18 acetylase RimI-like enzyme